MAVQQLFFSDKDGLEMALKNQDTMLFQSKADADARDRVLQLAENLRLFLCAKVEGLTEETADLVAMAIAEEKDLIAMAFKKPSALADHMAKVKPEDAAPSL